MLAPEGDTTVVTLRASAPGGALTAETTIPVGAYVPVLAGLELFGPDEPLLPEETWDFAPAAVDQRGASLVVTPSWTATGGSIDDQGRFVAPAASGTVTITASAAGMEASVEVVVADDAPPDDGPPAVVGTYPLQRATGTALDVSVLVSFSEPMAPGSFEDCSLDLSAGGATVDGALEVRGSDVFFVPNEPLTASTTYTARVAPTVTDLGGSPLGEELVLSFSTGDGTTADGGLPDDAGAPGADGGVPGAPDGGEGPNLPGTTGCGCGYGGTGAPSPLVPVLLLGLLFASRASRARQRER